MAPFRIQVKLNGIVKYEKTFFNDCFGSYWYSRVGTSNNAHADEVSTGSSTIVQAESVLDESVVGGSTNEGHSITKER